MNSEEIGGTLFTTRGGPAIPGAMSAPSSRVQNIVFGSKIPAAIATPELLSSTPLLCSSVTIVASRGRTVNTGSVFLGTSATNDSQLYPLTPGQSLTLLADEAGLIDLSQIYVDAATLTDGVIFCAVTHAL